MKRDQTGVFPFLDDKNITWRAKGLLLYFNSVAAYEIPSLADIDHIAENCKDSPKTVWKELRELMRFGYIEKKGEERWFVYASAKNPTGEQDFEELHPFKKIEVLLGKDKAKTVIPIIGKNKIDVEFIEYILEDKKVVDRLKEIENPAGYIVKLSKSDKWRLYQQQKFLEGSND
jgi:DNA-binding transcriptional regulator YhcF (GntR family)